MKHRDVIQRLNAENERRLIGRPLLILLLSSFGVCILLILVVNFGEEVDAFTQRHPLLTGWSLVSISLVGFYYFFKNRIW